MSIKQVYFIADGFQALDLFGPLDAFMETNSFISSAYSVKLLSLHHSHVKSVYGQCIQTDFTVNDDFEVDDLILCGGSGMRTLTFSSQQLRQLRGIANKANRVFSICTGAFILAKLFPDEPMSVTSHWRHCEALAKQNHTLKVCNEPLFVKHGNKWSSAGVLSGVDLALAIIKQDFGNAISVKVAKELVVYVQRSGSQNQFSEMLVAQSGESLRLSPVIDWLNQHINRSVTVSEMACYANTSERQLTRLFKQHLNCSPSQYFRKLKLNYARDLLSNENVSMHHVAHQIGFSSYDSFRRAFHKQFNVSPNTYKKRS